MTPRDVDGFFALEDNLDPDAYLWLEYAMECQGDPRAAAAHFCSEQSTAQWSRIGCQEDLRDIYAAKVVDLRIEGTQAAFSAGVRAPLDGPVTRVRLRIAHPHGNFGPRIPNLLSAICGEGTFFSPGAPVVKLLDIRFPNAFLRAFEGPRFGVSGFRALLGAYDRPIFFGVIKPNIGLSADAMADLGLEAWLGGLDVAKDDEMLCDTDWCPLQARASALGAARRRAESATGTPKIYLANITDEVDRLAELHDLAVARGANAVMLNALPVGLSAARMMARHTQVPLVAHFPMIAASSRVPTFGISTLMWTRLQRLAGFDVIIMPGFGDRMFMSDAEVCANVAACLEPMGGIAPSLPVPGGSDWAGTLGRIHDRLGTTDFGFVPGRGIFGHPMGPRGGAASVCQAWEAIAAGRSLDAYADDHAELKAAIETFGSRSEPTRQALPGPPG